MAQKWGLSFDINTEPGPAGRSAGSLAWAGLFNTYFWVDPNKRVTGTIMTQLLPFADAPGAEAFRRVRAGMCTAAVASPRRGRKSLTWGRGRACPRRFGAVRIDLTSQ